MSAEVPEGGLVCVPTCQSSFLCAGTCTPQSGFFCLPGEGTSCDSARGAYCVEAGTSVAAYVPDAPCRSLIVLYRTPFVNPRKRRHQNELLVVTLKESGAGGLKTAGD